MDFICCRGATSATSLAQSCHIVQNIQQQGGCTYESICGSKGLTYIKYQYQYQLIEVNNYKMNLANYQAPSPWKNKTQKTLMIRSPAFQKKFQEGLPRINHKAIPFHNVYDIEISNMQIAEQHGLKFWGCVIPERKKYNSVDPNKTMQRIKTQNRGETMFKKYMTRRPSLNLTPRTYQVSTHSNAEEPQKKYTTITDFKQQKQYKHNNKNGVTDRAQYKYEEHYNQNGTLYVTNDQIMAINKKSVYQMTPLELEISIEWKKRFLQVFDKKVKDARSKELILH